MDEHSSRSALADLSNCVQTVQTIKGAARLVVTGSGFYGAAKQELQRLVHSIGGHYSGDLVHGVTTHLIAKRLIDCFGTAKYQRALEWGINIVTYDWLLASSSAGRALPEQDFKDDQPGALKPSPLVARKQLQRAQPAQQPHPEEQQQQQPVPQSPAHLQGAHGTDAGAAPSPAAVATAAEQGRKAGREAAAEASEEQQPERSDVLWQPQLDLLPSPCAGISRLKQQRQRGGGSSSTQSPLQELPDDFLLLGSPSFPAADACQQLTRELQSGRSPSFSLSQLASAGQQQQQKQPEPLPGMGRSTWISQIAAAAGAASTGSGDGDAAGSNSSSFNFQPRSPAQQTSPCVQHFLPLQSQQQQQQQQEGGASPQHPGLQQQLFQQSSEIQADGIQQPAVQQQQQQQQLNLELPTETSSEASDAGSPAALTTCGLAAALASAVEADVGDAGDVGGQLLSLLATASSLSGSEGHAGSGSDSELGIEPPDATAETAAAAVAADEADPAAAWPGDNEESEDATEETEETDDVAAEPAAQQHSSSQVQPGAAADEEESADADSTEEETGPAAWEAAGEDCGGLLVPETQAELCDPWAAAAAAQLATPMSLKHYANQQAERRQQQQQQQIKHQQSQQQAAFTRLTTSSQRSTGGGSSSSSGLQRLRRQDGYRRAEHLLVSELLPELEDSDCSNEEELADSDCSAGCRDAAAGGSPEQCSPLHSCSGSSLPAHSGAYSSSAGAAGSNGDGAASVSTTPVMRLSFSSEQQQYIALTGGSSSGGSSSSSGASGGGPARSGGGSSGVDSRGGRLQLKARQALSAATTATAVALLQKQQQLKQQQVEQLSQDAATGLLSPPSAGSLFVTRRKGGKPAAAAVAGAAPSDAAAGLQPVRIKAEPVTGQQQQQQHGTDAAGAEVLLQDLQQQQQQQPRAALVKQEPAEALLASIRSKQQQASSSRQKQLERGGGGAAAAAAEGIDDDATQDASAAAAAAAAAAARLRGDRGVVRQAPAGRLSTSSYTSLASFATNASSAASRKVPLALVGGGAMQLLPDEQLEAADAAAGAGTSSSQGAVPGCSPLENLLQQALAETAAASRLLQDGPAGAAASTPAAAATTACASKAPLLQDRCGQPAAGVCIKQEQQQDESRWLHTPEDLPHPQQQHQQRGAEGSDGDEGLEITELPTGHLAARGKAMSRHLGVRLAHLSAAEGKTQVVPLKLLAKAPRGSTAKAHHGLRSSSRLVFAEQIQVPSACATFSTKERSKCMIVRERPVGGDGNQDAGGGQQEQAKVYLAEPVAFYKLEDGDWWCELLRFYSARDLRLLAKGAGSRLALPADFQLEFELLRGMAHSHVRMSQVAGEFKLSKVRKAPAAGGGGRGRTNPFFWRFCVDTVTCKLMTAADSVGPSSAALATG